MVHLICTLEPIRISFLGQFIQHYARLGVESFHLSLQIEPGSDPAHVEASTSEASRVLKAYDLELHGVLMEPFSSFVLRQYHDRLQDRTSPSAWATPRCAPLRTFTPTRSAARTGRSPRCGIRLCSPLGRRAGRKW